MIKPQKISLTNTEYLSLRNSDEALRISIEQAMPTLGTLVLDIGCGSMPLTPLFHQKRSIYIGVDINQSVKPHAVMVAERLAVRSRTVDLILCIATLEHVMSPQAVLSEASRVLKKGGSIIVQVPSLYPYHPSPEDHWRWTHTGLEQILRNAGLTVTAFYPSGTTLTTYLTIFIQGVSLFLIQSKVFSWLNLPVVVSLNSIGRLLEKFFSPNTPFYAPGNFLLSLAAVARKEGETNLQ